MSAGGRKWSGRKERKNDQCQKQDIDREGDREQGDVQGRTRSLQFIRLPPPLDANALEGRTGV